MKRSLFASIALATLRTWAWRSPSRCPYCPGARDKHWIKWGFYERFAEASDAQIEIQRYRCKVTLRTFSLLPDSVLPYHFYTGTHILQWLHALFVQRQALNALARTEQIARGTLRYLKRCFLGAVGILRLPGRAAALKHPHFMRRLAKMGTRPVANLFRDWKELEPKHSVVGIYPR